MSWVAIALTLLSLVALPARAEVDGGVIRLGSPPAAAQAETPEEVAIGEPRDGFDYTSFEARLESLWFQRKTFLADGRFEDAERQLEQIRAFCFEEGVHRLENVAGALVAESKRLLAEGNRQQALSSLEFAESFDPGRPQVHLARAAVHWEFGDYGSVVGDLFRAGLTGWVRGTRDLSLAHQMVYLAGLALVGAIVVFGLLMLVRYQVPFRHEVEEWFAHVADQRWCAVAGWAALALPLILWVGAGWAAVWWIVITFRFMTRSERLAATVLLAVSAVTVPLYNVAISLYGTNADPAVRTTLASADGEYDPDRIVRLRQLVDAHPDDPVYRFLLAGLYENGRYFEEAFAEYKKALDLRPELVSAMINIGNIFYTTGQYGDAVAYYSKALEHDPESFLAHFNMHLAQSESFKFKEAEASLRAAREIDADRVAKLLSGSGDLADRTVVQDATLQMASIWEAALSGRRALRFASDGDVAAPDATPVRLVNAISVVSVLGLLGCLGLGLTTRREAVARRCIRCGRPFCHRCKSAHNAKEYCSQCLHLFVLGDGLEPGTKARKLYEVERYERRSKRTRRFASWLLPGSGQVLRGKPGWGIALVVAWFVAVIAAEPSVLAPVAWITEARFGADIFLGSSDVPAVYSHHPLRLVAVAALPLIWLSGNRFFRRREV